MTSRSDVTLSVVVPTYNRPVDLARTLEVLLAAGGDLQEVCVVVRESDEASAQVVCRMIQRWGAVTRVDVSEPGQVAAMNAGLTALRPCDIVLFLDDDACLQGDWVKTLRGHFRDPNVGGVGGKDHWVNSAGESRLVHPQEQQTVGRITWFGRTIGNHHLGGGRTREVDILKGVLMAYRYGVVKEARFDTRLRGSGAQVHNDMDWSLRMRRAGWRLLYDPELVCDHYLADRFDEDQRDTFRAEAVSNAVHNHALVVLQHLSPLRRLVYMAWGVLVGTRGEYGLVQVLRNLPRDKEMAIRRGWAAVCGRLAGGATFSRSTNSPPQPAKNSPAFAATAVER